MGLGNITFVVGRRVGDFIEYLQHNGGFGPLVDHQKNVHYLTRTDITRVFSERDQAEAVVKAMNLGNPSTVVTVPLEVWRIP